MSTFVNQLPHFLPCQMLTGMDTEDFLSSLLEGNNNMPTALGPSHSPQGSDSGISDDSSTVCGGSGNGNANNLLTCPSPQDSDGEPVPSPSYSQPSPVYSDTTLPPPENQAENPEALTVHTDHCYSLAQGCEGDLDALQSVRAEKPDMDVFIDLGVYHVTEDRDFLRRLLSYVLMLQHVTYSASHSNPTYSTSHSNPTYSTNSKCL